MTEASSDNTVLDDEGNKVLLYTVTVTVTGSGQAILNQENLKYVKSFQKFGRDLRVFSKKRQAMKRKAKKLSEIPSDATA